MTVRCTLPGSKNGKNEIKLRHQNMSFAIRETWDRNISTDYVKRVDSITYTIFIHFPSLHMYF